MFMKKAFSNVIEKLAAAVLQFKCRHRYIIIAMWRHIYDKVTSSRQQSAKWISKAFDNTVVAMVTDIWRHLCRTMADSKVIANLRENGRQRLPCSTKFSMTL